MVSDQHETALTENQMDDVRRKDGEDWLLRTQE